MMIITDSASDITKQEAEEMDIRIGTSGYQSAVSGGIFAVVRRSKRKK